MKATYIEYYETSAYSGKLVNPCGDRSIIKLDARMSLENAHKVAKENNGMHRPKYEGYQLYTGELNRQNYKPITDIIML